MSAPIQPPVPIGDVDQSVLAEQLFVADIFINENGVPVYVFEF